MTTAQNAQMDLNRNPVGLVIDSIRRRVVQARVYRDTVRSLSDLPDRELQDLGLSRSMIPSIAREAALAA